MESEKAWLDPSFLSWQNMMDGVVISYLDTRTAEYKFWAHAEKILSEYDDKLHRADVIGNLNKAIRSRFTALNEIYQFKKIPIDKYPKRFLEQLAFWNIVRPTMLRNLIDIRNAVEHEFIDPPQKERCQELVDLVWYYYRTTDNLAVQNPESNDGLIFVDEISDANPELEHNVGFGFHPKQNWLIETDGWISSAMISVVPIPGWIELSGLKLRSLEETMARSERAREAHQNRDANDVHFEATVAGPESFIEHLIRIYFSKF